jgi:hypothetical protein
MPKVSVYVNGERLAATAFALGIAAGRALNALIDDRS